MNNADNPELTDDVRQRIANLLRANAQARKRQITGEELTKLKSAASRLDQILNAAAHSQVEGLKNAVAKLDELLTEMQNGRDVSHRFKARGDGDKRE